MYVKSIIKINLTCFFSTWVLKILNDTCASTTWGSATPSQSCCVYLEPFTGGRDLWEAGKFGSESSGPVTKWAFSYTSFHSAFLARSCSEDSSPHLDLPSVEMAQLDLWEIPRLCSDLPGVITGVQRPSCFIHLVIITHLQQTPAMWWELSWTERRLGKRITLKLTVSQFSWHLPAPAWGDAILCLCPQSPSWLPSLLYGKTHGGSIEQGRVFRLN